jgi:voltage-gated sodium channel
MQSVSKHAEPAAYVDTVEKAFVAFYTIELILRVLVHRLYFFVNVDMKWNLFDFSLVTSSILAIIMEKLATDSDIKDVIFLRTLRLAKLAKVFRAVRAARKFKDLAAMMESFKNSVMVFLWSIVALAFNLFLFALIFINGFNDCMAEDCITEDDPDYAEAMEYFGSMRKSILSLYMAVTGGQDWAVYHGVIQRIGPMYECMYIFFILFFTFALFNLLTGIFVEKAVLAATPSRDERILERRQKSIDDARELGLLCSILANGDDTITWEEFQGHMKDPDMVAYLASVGLQVNEVSLFFKMIAGSGDKTEVSIDRFVEGCMSMNGMATGVDMQRQLYELGPERSK